MKVIFLYSNRAEYSLLSPYLKYFKKKNQVSEIDLSKKIMKIENDKNLYKIYELCYNDFKKKKYDFLIILGDRRELPLIALAAFYLDIKIVHIGAGEFADGLPAYDQIIRPIISLLSKYQICFSKDAKTQVDNLFEGISYLKPKSFNVGNAVFADIDISKFKKPIKEKYDMVLLHPQSLSKKNTEDDVKKLKRILAKNNKKIVIVKGNKDKNFEIIENFYQKINKKNILFFENLPKEKYFSYVKFCDKFYTNTSSLSEIEFLNKKSLKIIGKRNKNRSRHVMNINAPKKLYTILNNSS